MKKARNSVSGARKRALSSEKPETERQRSNINLREIQDLVAELRPDDGIDPRLEAKRRNRAPDGSQPGLAHGINQQERFTVQVQMAIDFALQTAVTPILNSLTVYEVVKRGGSLLVVVVPRNPVEPLDLKVAAKALKQASSKLRREVASAITRKETPNLSFVVLPAGAEKVVE